MNSLGRNQNKNFEKTFSGDNLYHKKKMNEVVDIFNVNNNKNIIMGKSSIEAKEKNSNPNFGTGMENDNTSYPNNKEKLIRISEFKIEPAIQNKNDNKYSLNNSKDLINRLKDQASSLKSSIINKNQINNKNKVNCFQFEDKENLSINKYIQNELSHCHLVKGINILSKHETFEIDHKKYIYGDKNKFNKNSCFFNDKNNNSNNNKNYEMLSKIKNLKTFHPTKFSENNKKSISIKVNKGNIENAKNQNTNTNLDTYNNLQESKNNESVLKEKNKSLSKNKHINKSKDKTKNKERNDNEILKKDKKTDISEKENTNKFNKKIIEENKAQYHNEKEVEKNKEEIKIEINHKNENKEIIDINKENTKKKENTDEKEKIKNEKEYLSKIKNHKKLYKEEEKVIEVVQEEKVIYFDISKINNVQIPKDYINIIYYNLLKEENVELDPKPVQTYMKNQKEINEQMRSILVDWIIDVHHKFGFTDETLFMTVLIIDRYSSIEEITRIKYQCLGITALMIACKHEEINVPKVEDFIYITDNAYTKEEVFQMENDVLSKLHFSLLYPSPIKFYEYLSLNFNFNKKYHMLGKYLMESFLLDLKYIKYKPSIISCACTYIVMKFFKMKNYRQSYDKKFYLIDENINTISNGYGVKDCAQEICVFVDNINNTNLLSCQKKYAKPEFENVSTLISNNK